MLKLVPKLAICAYQGVHWPRCFQGEIIIMRKIRPDCKYESPEFMIDYSNFNTGVSNEILPSLALFPRNHANVLI